MGKIHILSILGSLRKESYNKALLDLAIDMSPPEAEIEKFDLNGIPLFDQDLEMEPPQKVTELKSKIRTADSLLIITPEYNYSIPGVLKNAIDWASRPYSENPFKDKPVAFMGASIGMLGTARAQYHLRQCCVFLNMHPLNYPEVMVPFVQEKIDRNGKVIDKFTQEKVRDLINALVNWTIKLNRG
jgi:chromate reductase